jgi:DeoR/GlpR family transcriptional regulator of sugar metabolism
VTGEGLVERVHGGARSLDGDNEQRIETDWDKRVRQGWAAKEAMGARAASLVDDNATIFVDASSTCLAFARALAGSDPRPLTLVTNSPAIAFELTADQIHVIMVPGEVDQQMRLIAGRWAIEFLADLHIDLAFVSAAGITLEQGLTTSRRPLADVVNAARAVAGRSIALIDSSKFGRRSLLTICRPDELDLLIVDAGVPSRELSGYRRAGASIEVAAEPVPTT